MEIRHSLRFWLNDEFVELHHPGAGTTLLDHIRLAHNLKGSKEGCAEGDCGACTAIVGRLHNDRLVYESVNACIRLIGSCDGTHIVTIEHLVGDDGRLHPVQQAMAEHHGTQCGFCTPGFVMSLYAMWMAIPQPDVPMIERYLQGNLCRCTGYQPIIQAALAISNHGRLEEDFLLRERTDIISKLRALRDNATIEAGDGKPEILVPADIDQLAEIYARNPAATLVAGATDVGLKVTKSMCDISPAIFTSRLDDFRKVVTSNRKISIDGGASYTDMLPTIDEYLPQLARFWRRIGGEQVRNMGTIGGNVANGSPIGDTPPPLIALGARLILRRNAIRREIALEDFFIEYGRQNRAPGEFVERILVPLPTVTQLFAAYKVSKRRDEDISAVCGAFNLTIEDGRIADARIAYGGMAGIPKRAANVEQALVGRPWSEPAIMDAKLYFQEDFTPLTDWRASASYRLDVARNLLERFYFDHAAGAEPGLEDLHHAASRGSAP